MTDRLTPFTPELALDVWYQALGQEFGVIFSVHDPQDIIAIVNECYQARKDINDPRLAALSIHLTETGVEIMIYRKEGELDD